MYPNYEKSRNDLLMRS